MRTYRELYAIREFRHLFAVVCVRSAGSTMEGIALGTLVYRRTGSPLLAALSMFGPSAAQVLGGATLLSWADRVRPRRALVVVGALYSVVALLLALPVPASALLSIALLSGLIGSLGGAVQWGLVREVVPADGYVLARSTFTVAAGLTQILGFGAGGALADVIGSRLTLLIAAVIFAGSSVAARRGLRPHPRRRDGAASVRVTWRDNRRLLGTGERRTLYVMLWVPNGLVVGCEALFIPYSPRWAGVLMGSAALGMLGGDVLVGRVLPGRVPGRTARALRLLLAAPYLTMGFAVPLPVAAVVVAVASVGYGAGLLLQQRLLAVVPDEMAGQALGLHSAGMLSFQAVAAAVAGALAAFLRPGAVMTVLAAASMAVTLSLAPRLRTADRWLAGGGATRGPSSEGTSTVPPDGLAGAP